MASNNWEQIRTSLTSSWEYKLDLITLLKSAPLTQMFNPTYTNKLGLAALQPLCQHQPALRSFRWVLSDCSSSWTFSHPHGLLWDVAAGPNVLLSAWPACSASTTRGTGSPRPRGLFFLHVTYQDVSDAFLPLKGRK